MWSEIRETFNELKKKEQVNLILGGDTYVIEKLKN